MSNPTGDIVRDSLNIIWAITSKDIVDALKNRLIVSLIFMASLMLLLPKMLPYIFEQPDPVLPIYDLGDSSLLAGLQDQPALTVLKVRSQEEFDLALCNALYPEIGLLIPVDFDQVVAVSGTIELQGFACWSKRFQVPELLPELEKQLTQTLGKPVTIRIAGNTVFPPAIAALFTRIASINLVVVILMVGIVIVPNLLFDEKQAKTMQALLVSPASISQVVMGKALAGLFYILVTGLIVFTISWADVTHWGAVVTFVIAGGIFSVAVGLALGSFYDKPQDIAGWITVLLVILIGGLIVKMVNLELPAIAANILPWLPSVALSEVCRLAFIEDFSIVRLMANLGVVLTVALPLYGLVIWKVRRSDR